MKSPFSHPHPKFNPFLSLLFISIPKKDTRQRAQAQICSSAHTVQVMGGIREGAQAAAELSTSDMQLLRSRICHC